jgi:hypothetical protein
MIASQKIGKSFMGALNYNLKKMNHPGIAKRAELLDTNFTSLDAKQIGREIDLLRQLRPSLNRYVYHTSLNFAKEDELDNDQLLSIALQYLEANGFTNNQYMIFRHHDADHMHLHLLVNRITFDGDVVSDSNNYKKSEAVLRQLERQYNLKPVEPSSKVQQRAAKKDELEMVIRTGKPSDKMVIQELLRKIVASKKLTLTELIKQGEQVGIHFLFNQASTGRISGITYFYQGLKIKGQALGNSFKWAELIKSIDYEQIRDRKAVSEANGRTTELYGELTTAGRNGDNGLRPGSTEDTRYNGGQSGGFEELGNEDNTDRKRSLETDQAAGILVGGTAVDLHDDPGTDISIQISDDVDDEAIYGRNRRRQKKARTNTR